MMAEAHDCGTCVVATQLREELARLHKAAEDVMRLAGLEVFDNTRCDRCGERGPATIFDKGFACGNCRAILLRRLNEELFR
jgi:tRNA(Ile2) C34 agmatinyltransferase TiaS